MEINDNATTTSTTTSTSMPPSTLPTPALPTPNVMDVKITNDNDALNVMVTFLQMAQKRGVFNLQESAKIWECVKMFLQPQ